MLLAWYDIIGSLGVVAIVAAYFLLQVGRLDPRAPLYSWLNLAGAVMILISLYHEFDFSAAAMEAFWVLISLVGLFRVYRSRVSDGGDGS